jgi:16S rRNA (guanine527-N7)-methyltransferase
MKELAQQVHALVGIRLTRLQLAALGQYEGLLLEWNSRYNLTAIRDPQEIRARHFLDSLTCLIAMRGTPMERVIDVGSGAGFPGIPLKIACPDMQLTLLESIGKKADFCRQVVQSLNLKAVSVISGRAETLGQASDHRQRYDWALARAVAVMPVLAEYLLPLVKIGGHALAMKGESAPAEAQSAENALRLLGGSLRQLIPVTLPSVVEEHYLVVVDKTASTPAAYPRRVGIPAKKPL